MCAMCSIYVMKTDHIIEHLRTANLKRLARETGLARSTLQRLKYGRTGKMTPGTRRLIMDVLVRSRDA